ncbi:MAG TPA: dihydropteroate synthase [Gemmatimonadales bacterium]|nr:dihydropteroate synthase [Gemmatimonadales bacterium]
MIVTPLALHSPSAVRDALRGHGWDEGQAAASATGSHALAFHVTALDERAIEALVPMAGRLGLDLVTGPDWVVLSGSRARIGALARPWTVPEALSELALQLGLALPGEPVAAWRTARGPVPLDRPVLVGILNVTPDSFSDGGRHQELDAALAHADRLLEDGADVIDLGAQSSRPGAGQVGVEEELARLRPVLAALVARHPALVVSVDTVRAEVARVALEEGAAAVNDVSALRLEPAIAEVAAARGAGLILMHSRGGFEEMASYTHAAYGDVVGEVVAELRGALATAVAAGVAEEAIVLDPGLGFSKRVAQNALLLDRLAALEGLGRPVLVGPSRKRFLGVLAGIDEPAGRDGVTAVACALAYERGARLFRVHDVAATRAALALARGVLDARADLQL